ncbi:MAG: hypothetical protein OEM60_09410 [Gammaproteobacteria bacterium]|nr:hypothetical protein [Gammaproteobacteria bacterium]MDH3434063.1 hypothetical protein [Gammaproteobacteria bacterium]
MTDERKRSQTAADSEELVSRTYREIATDGAPEHLNRAILKKAARAARPRYARFRTWTRPLAWAATVVLCAALVLEITQLPVPDGVGFDEDFSAGKAKTPAAEVAGDQETGASEESIRPATPAGGASGVALDSVPTKSTVTEAASEASIEQRQRLDLQKTRADAMPPTPPESSADEFRLSDRAILQRAEDMVRMQNDNDRPTGTHSASEDALASDVAARGAAAPVRENEGCDESARDTPESWLECIAMLEKAGRADEADRQREMLRQIFPDLDSR